MQKKLNLELKQRKKSRPFQKFQQRNGQKNVLKFIVVCQIMLMRCQTKRMQGRNVPQFFIQSWFSVVFFEFFQCQYKSMENQSSFRIKMRKSYITLTLLALLATLSVSTFIIASGKVKQFDLGHGKTMVVFGEDVEEDDSNQDDIEQISESSGAIQINAKKPSKPKKSQAKPQVQPAATTQINTPVQKQKSKVEAQTSKVQSQTSKPSPQTPKVSPQASKFSSQTSKGPGNHKRRVAFISSFGSLGKRDDEDTYRSLIFQKNRKWIDQHNNKTQFTFTLGENQFTSLSVEQFASLYLTLSAPKNVPSFDFDIRKEIKKFRKQADEFIDKFFGFSNSPNNPNNFIPFPTFPSFPSFPNPTPFPTPKPKPIPNPTPRPTPSPTPRPTPTPTPSPTPIPNTPSVTPSSTPTNTNIVLNIDWVANGAVSSVKDQGSCGSCYSFSTQATIQSAYLILNKTLYANIDLSQQQIVDCSGAQGNNGCGGGWLPNVYTYAINYGVTTQSNYPYTQVAASCKVSGGAYKISNYQGGALSNCSALAAMVTGRPVAVAVSAGNQYWQGYTSGIMNTCTGSVDHGVSLVGVYQDDTQNYWKIKNSWGPSWGENGFIRLDRSVNSGNICSVCSFGYYPQI